MAGTKRSSAEAGVSDAKRSPKAAKKSGGSPSSKARKADSSTTKNAGGSKPTMTAAEFKLKALPLHVNITHTPPVIPEDEDKVPASSADPGFIGSSALIPSKFNTGSYGWKGSKRVTIEVENPEGGDKEKVQVMISINATVLGSKPRKADHAKEDAKEDEHNAENEESADEHSTAEDEE